MASWNRSDPKPEKRVRASQSGWSDLHETFRNEVCVHCAHRPVELHHILPRSQSGDDVRENLCPLCRPCHTTLEGHGPGWERIAASVRRYVMSNNHRRWYQEDHAGESFNRRYPALPNEDPQFLDDRALLFARHAQEIEGHSR